MEEQVTESIETVFGKDIVEWCLSTLAPNVRVPASQMTEDGWVLVLEGNVNEVSQLIYALGQGVK